MEVLLLLILAQTNIPDEDLEKSQFNLSANSHTNFLLFEYSKFKFLNQSFD